MRFPGLIAAVLPFLLFENPATAQGQPLLRYIDPGEQASSRLLVSDSAGNLFVISTFVKPSGRPQISVIKTDGRGNVVGSLNFGGSLADMPNGAAVDPQGNVVVVGTTSSPNFPLVSPLFSKTAGLAGFVVKLDSQLQRIVFSTLLGGTQGGGPEHAATSANAVAIDNGGNIYVTGNTTATDFPTTPGALQTSPPQSNAFGSAAYAFITEISSMGDRLINSTYFGGSETNCNGGSVCLGAFGQTSGTAIAIGQTGDIVVAGNTSASKLPVTRGTLGQQCLCDSNIQAGFVAELTAGLVKLEWATYATLVQQGADFDSNVSIVSLAVDKSGDVIVGGTAPEGFPVTPGALQSTYPGGNFPQYAGFVSRIDPTGSRYIFSTYLGGGVAGSPNGVMGVGVGTDGIIWTTGGSLLSRFPLPGSFPQVGPAYVAAVTSDGARLNAVFTAPRGGAGQAIAVTSQNQVVALGSAGSLLIGGMSHSPSLIGVANSAADSVSGQVAPFELVSFYGVGLGPPSPVSGHVVNGTLATSLGGVKVMFDGVAASLLYAGPSQINAVVPGEIAGRDTTDVHIITPEGTISGLTLFVVPSKPDVFGTISPDSFLPKAGVALNQDGTLNSASNPAKAHSIVTVWATGGGYEFQTDGAIAGRILRAPELPVSVLAVLDSLEVLYAGDAPGMVAGVLQINFRLPESSSFGVNQLGCQLQIGEGISEFFAIYVKR